MFPLAFRMEMDILNSGRSAVCLVHRVRALYASKPASQRVGVTWRIETTRLPRLCMLRRFEGGRCIPVRYQVTGTPLNKELREYVQDPTGIAFALSSSIRPLDMF